MRGGQSYPVEWSDESHTYRYVWRDRWSQDTPPMLVACLIPSTADEDNDDATVRFCREVARCVPEVDGSPREGFGELIVVNMYSRVLAGSHMKEANVNVDDLVGPGNDNRIEAIAGEVRNVGGKIVVAWGDGGWARHGRMLRLLGYPRDDVWCFATKEHDDTGKTKNGFPCHPSPQGSLRRVRKAKPNQIVLKRF